MRRRRAALFLTGLGLLVACSGAAVQDVLDPGETRDAGGSATPSSASDSAADGSAGIDGAADASAECPTEIEPNDTKESADTLAPTLCGALDPASDVDFVTFQPKPSSTSVKLTFTGKVVLRVEVNGAVVTLGGPGNGSVPFEKGQRYTVEVRATDRTNHVPWRVDLVEK